MGNQAAESSGRHYSAEVKDQRLQALFERASDAILVALLDGTLTAVNPAACRLVGYTQEELIGMNARNLVAHEWLDVAAQQSTRKIAGIESETIYELAFVDRLGSRIPVEMRSTILELDGEIVGMHAVARDLRERRRANAALTESEQRVQS